jgi:hypothetical protein
MIGRSPNAAGMSHSNRDIKHKACVTAELLAADKQHIGWHAHVAALQPQGQQTQQRE